MTDTTTSQQKVELLSHEVIKRGKSDYLQLIYKRLDGQSTGQEQKTGAFVAQLDDESKSLIKKGGTVVLTKTKSGEYWNLTTVRDVSTYVEKPMSTYNRSGGARYSGTNNTAGIKVGAVLHDAVALAGACAKISAVKTIAEELLHLSYELEANVNAGKYEPASTTTTKDTSTTETSVSLENIEF